MDNIQNIFFSKNNIILLANKIVETIKIPNLTNEHKNIILKHMNNVWKDIDISKINKNNIQSILNQFNTISFNNSISEINSKMNSNLSETSKLKFERDFNSIPNKTIKIPERSQSILGSNAEFMQESYNNQKKANIFNKNMDILFKPIVENIPDEATFNNYNFNKNNGNTKQKLDEILSSRESEVSLPKRPSTPDFLKSKQTTVKQENDFSNTNNNTYNNTNNNFNIKNINDNDINNAEYEFLSNNNDDNQNLFDINNIDKPIVHMEINEDSAPFEERLTKLQNERNNIKIPTNMGKIDFTDENLNPTSINDIKNKKKGESEYYKEIEIQKNQEEQALYKQMQRHQAEQEQEQEQEQAQEQELYKQMQRQQAELMRKQQAELMQKQQAELMQKKQVEQYKTNQYQQSNKFKQKKEINSSEYIKIFNKLKELNKKLKEDKNILLQKNSELTIENNKILENNKIISENNKIDSENINNKMNDLNNLLSKYSYLFKIRNYQIELTSPTFSSNYIYNFKKLDNIININLLTYSIPLPVYNIENNKNNLFKYIINNEVKEIRLNTGKYNIEQLLLYLNNIINDIKFSIDEVSQKIIVSAEENFEIIPTILSKENLGFINNCDNNNSYIADNIWDLRMNDKLYLFFTNINEQIPFSILYYNNISNAQFKFESPISLEFLEIKITDSKYRDYYFYNLHHYINIQIDLIT